MALGNPVLTFSSRWRWRDSRAIELAVVVGLTVAVVAVAVLWGGSSSTTAPEAVSQVETIPAEPPSSTAGRLDSAPAAAEANTVLAEPELGVHVAAVEASAPEHVIPSQTGIVPGRPDPLEPASPDSFERYQVQRGESLFSIASARGVSVDDLLLWNWRLEGDSSLIRGEWIWIPLWDLPIVADEAGLPTEEGKSGRGGG